uniref:(northern house mosquito) hypothetical protein n=1 Tax=Culex pipiens TaxID=7175 RepID=A0A8D8N586_CULPI
MEAQRWPCSSVPCARVNLCATRIAFGTRCRCTTTTPRPPPTTATIRDLPNRPVGSKSSRNVSTRSQRWHRGTASACPVTSRRKRNSLRRIMTTSEVKKKRKCHRCRPSRASCRSRRKRWPRDVTRATVRNFK